MDSTLLIERSYEPFRVKSYGENLAVNLRHEIRDHNSTDSQQVALTASVGRSDLERRINPIRPLCFLEGIQHCSFTEENPYIGYPISLYRYRSITEGGEMYE